MRSKLRIKQEVDKASSDLVRSAEGLVKESNIFQQDSDFKEAQIRNVINVANSQESVPVVTNFIRYQIGRSKKNKGWEYNDFGEKLVTALDDLQLKAEEVKRRIKEDVTADELWIMMVRLYLGFLNRYYVYKKTERRG